MRLPYLIGLVGLMHALPTSAGDPGAQVVWDQSSYHELFRTKFVIHGGQEQVSLLLAEDHRCFRVSIPDAKIGVATPGGPLADSTLGELAAGYRYDLCIERDGARSLLASLAPGETSDPVCADRLASGLPSEPGTAPKLILSVTVQWPHLKRNPCRSDLVGRLIMEASPGLLSEMRSARRATCASMTGSKERAGCLVSLAAADAPGGESATSELQVELDAFARMLLQSLQPSGEGSNSIGIEAFADDWEEYRRLVASAGAVMIGRPELTKACEGAVRSARSALQAKDLARASATVSAIEVIEAQLDTPARRSQAARLRAEISREEVAARARKEAADRAERRRAEAQEAKRGRVEYCAGLLEGMIIGTRSGDAQERKWWGLIAVPWARCMAEYGNSRNGYVMCANRGIGDRFMEACVESR